MSASPDLLTMEAHMRRLREDYGSSREFMRLALTIGNTDEKDLKQTLRDLRYSTGATSGFTKDVVTAVSIDDAWRGSAGRDMAAAFMETIAEGSLFDLIARYAQPIPDDLPRVLLLTGASGNVIAEGAAKVVSRVNTTLSDLPLAKAVALMVYSEELSKLTGGQAERLLELEMKLAVLKAFNAAVLSSLTTTPMSAPGGSAVEGLKAGLQVAADSNGYVVSARPWAVRELALASDGRMGINGGEFIPGVHIVAVEGDSSSPMMTIIPASRVALTDLGLFVRNGRHASIMMSDTPSSPAQMVNLFQTDSRALLVERQYRMYSTENAIEVD